MAGRRDAMDSERLELDGKKKRKSGSRFPRNLIWTINNNFFVLSNVVVEF